MKDFNLILDKVSQALGTTVDNVVKFYPQLRTEYSWYYVLDKINDISENCLLTFGVIMLFACAYIFIDGYSAEKESLCKQIAEVSESIAARHLNKAKWLGISLSTCLI